MSAEAEAEAEREALILCQSLTCTAGLWREAIERTEPWPAEKHGGGKCRQAARGSGMACTYLSL